MKTKINFLPMALVVSILVLQSCLRDTHHILDQPDDKLLLSKVTGHNVPIRWNNFEFDNNWDYLATYSYGSKHFGWADYRPLQQVHFYNTGTWDFTYNRFFPDQIIDNSIPGKDLGYWQLYYNNKGQVIKTGLAFSTAAGPTQFEFYEYDNYNNLTSLVYGKYVDTPYFKQTYTYDARGNLTQWQLLFPNGYTNAAASTGQQIFDALATLPETEKFIGKNRADMLKKVLSTTNMSGIKANKSSSITSFQSKAAGDSNVIYQVFFTANITNDGKRNPYYQQDRILFFPATRLTSADLNTNYIDLQKSNTVKAEYVSNPDFGIFAPMVSNFTYTYNKLGYPVTSHEDFADPDGLWYGSPFTYTQDRQIEYISNH